MIGNWNANRILHVTVFTLSIMNDFVTPRISMVVMWAQCLVTVTINLLEYTILAQFEKLIILSSILLELLHYILCITVAKTDREIDKIITERKRESGRERRTKKRKKEETRKKENFSFVYKSFISYSLHCQCLV